LAELLTAELAERLTVRSLTLALAANPPTLLAKCLSDLRVGPSPLLRILLVGFEVGHFELSLLPLFGIRDSRMMRLVCGGDPMGIREIRPGRGGMDGPHDVSCVVGASRIRAIVKRPRAAVGFDTPARLNWKSGLQFR
jgi:hypothetical protein